MALATDIRNALGDYQPGEDAEINLKIKPLGTPAVTPATTTPIPQAELASAPTSVGGTTGTATGGAAPSPAVGGAALTPLSELPAGTPPPLPAGYGVGGATVVPTNQQLVRTAPALETHPLGARTDDIYEAAVAQLRQQTQSQYMQALGELGFMDEAGNFIPGTLETEAVRQRADIGRQREAALQQVLEDAVRGGTVFSGRRAERTAKAQTPYDAALANLETVLGRQIGERYSSLGDLTRQFELNRNALIADAAARYQASLEGGPGAGAYSGGGEGGGEGGAGEGVETAQEQQAQQVGPPTVPLSKQAWLARNPGGNYQNYLNAFNRHLAEYQQQQWLQNRLLAGRM
jgi:hypothetical protein